RGAVGHLRGRQPQNLMQRAPRIVHVRPHPVVVMLQPRPRRVRGRCLSARFHFTHRLLVDGVSDVGFYSCLQLSVADTIFTTETQRHSLLSYTSSSCVSVSLWCNPFRSHPNAHCYLSLLYPDYPVHPC